MQFRPHDPAVSAVPLYLISAEQYAKGVHSLLPLAVDWAALNHFEAAPDTRCVVPAPDGTIAGVLAGVTADADGQAGIWSIAALPEKLPPTAYRLDTSLLAQPPTAEALEAVLLGWELGCYSFDRYVRKRPQPWPELHAPEGVDLTGVEAMADAIMLTRDLINTPAADMLPSHLGGVCETLAKRFGAECYQIVGDALLAANYPMIHAVGRASDDPPRLIEMLWGELSHPMLTLVGKGVCFDSGGLDIKSSSNMMLMKKDMGGAAHALALAQLVMERELPVRLRVLIPAAENAISGNAFRPMDILRSRKGLTVEIGNTDAEGRLLLADALTEADSEAPDLIVDFATLTGAARVALGTELPALFTPDDALAADLQCAADRTQDPLWRLPLWQPYKATLSSKTADLNNAPNSPYGGAITAALFLKEFVQTTRAWAHIDLMAWNLTPRPGRPRGGEAMALRAVWAMLQARYGKPGK